MAGMDLPALICGYADRFAALGRGEHHVGSPLGAWLVLAFAAPVATGQEAEQIAQALGTDVDTAHSLAMHLLAHPHPAVSAAAAAWTQQDLHGLDPWLESLPSIVQTGPVPTQDQADAWAREQTLGMIDQFPIHTRGVVVLLASALATRLTWDAPFETADAADLRGPWSATLTRVLRTPHSRGHHAFITDTERAGRVAVHNGSADYVQVISVIADPAVAPVDVLAAAHEIAVGRFQRPDITSVSLFDLPLGEHPLWTITQDEALERGEHVDAVLPAWRASSRHDLFSVPDLGFDAIGPAMRQLAVPTGPIQVDQSAVAQYTRRGFEAAALTNYAIAVSHHLPPPPGPYRTATIRFAHPYAVVAITHGSTRDDPWYGVPVFAAWITDPDDADG